MVAERQPAPGLTIVTPPPASVRQAVTDWFNSEGLPDNFTLRQLADRAVARFREDADFLDLLIPEYFLRGGLLYDLMQQRVARTRHFAQRFDPATPLSARQHHNRLSKWSQFCEHANGRHVKLLTMRKGELLLAAKERRARGAVEARYAALWERLANGMTEEQTVGERYQVAEIEDAYRQVAQ